MRFQPRTLTLLPLALALSLSAFAQGKSSTNTPLRSAAQLQPATAGELQQQRRSDWILVVVNDEPITYQDLRSRVLRISVQLLHAGQALPPSAELEQTVLDKMITDRAMVQDAKDMGMTVDEASVQAALHNLATRSNMTENQLLQKLRNDGVSIVQLRSDLRDELLLERIHEHHINSAKVSEEEVDNWLAEQARLTGDASYERLHLAQILVAVPENASVAQVQSRQAKARQLAQQARRGSFAKVAETHSDGSRDMGGAMGLRLRDQYPDLFVLVANQLQVGEVSEPVRSPAGFHILKLLERRIPSAANTMVQTAVRHIILRSDEGQSQDQLVAQLTQLRQDILAGRIRFEEAAARYSQDGSAEQGGNLGWAEPGQFVPEFESVMDSLEPGRVSAPVVSRFGVHLIEVQDRQRVDLSELQQRELARQALKQVKGEENYKIWAEEVRARAYIEHRRQLNEMPN